ncbi:hypothetical protein LTR66_007761 [Elasticomyces elasticus]|nr:hypothetical protein LTR66_007761 [Elasticomyces elasticus]KAK5009184.1 hypothetical protein LTR28_002262 [Elasticomyces elasticus]
MARKRIETKLGKLPNETESVDRGSQFMKLPPELRVQIYQYLFPGKDDVIAAVRPVTGFEAFGSVRCANRLAILQTNSLVYKEAADVLYGTPVFSIATGNNRKYIHMLGLALKITEKDIEFEVVGGLDLTRPKVRLTGFFMHVRRIELQLVSVHRLMCHPRDMAKAHYAQNDLRRLAACLQTSPLMELNVRVIWRDMSIPVIDDEWLLSPIKALRKIKDVSVVRFVSPWSALSPITVVDTIKWARCRDSIIATMKSNREAAPGLYQPRKTAIIELVREVERSGVDMDKSRLWNRLISACRACEAGEEGDFEMERKKILATCEKMFKRVKTAEARIKRIMAQSG